LGGVQGLHVKWLANSEIYSETGTKKNFWEKWGARMKDVGAAVGFNLKLGLDCNFGELHGVLCKSSRFSKEMGIIFELEMI
jgi:hypothetical protein